jgi:hypothetical protein
MKSTNKQITDAELAARTQYHPYAGQEYVNYKTMIECCQPRESNN